VASSLAGPENSDALEFPMTNVLLLARTTHTQVATDGALGETRPTFIKAQ